METADRIRHFIMTTCRLSELDDDEDLIEAGLLNSLLLAQLLDFLETDLETEIRNEDLLAGNFRSVAAIDEVVRTNRSTDAGR